MLGRGVSFPADGAFPVSASIGGHIGKPDTNLILTVLDITHRGFSGPQKWSKRDKGVLELANRDWNAGTFVGVERIRQGRMFAETLFLQ